MRDSCTVVRRAALSSLAGVVRRDEAAASLAGVDPLLRALARRRAQGALLRAQARTSVDDPLHAARVAYLELAGVLPEGAIDDVEAVRAAFDTAGGVAKRPTPRGPWLTLLVVLLCVVTPSALALWRVRTRPFDPRHDPAGIALGDVLPGRAVALSRDPSASLAPVRARLVARDVRDSVGDEAASRLVDLADAMGDVARLRAEGPDQHTDRFFSAGTAANAALAAKGAPYFLDLDVWRRKDGSRWPIVYAYYVEREREVLAGGKSIRSVHLWRLDRLALGQPYLGYTHPRAGAALVLLDQVETELIQLVLPALSPAEGVELAGDEGDPDPGADWPAVVESRAGDLLRDYFAGAEDRATLERIGALLVRRRAIVRKWKRELPLVGLDLRAPARLVPEADYASELRHRVPSASLDEWDRIHDELLAPGTVAAFERLRDRFAFSTERHEVQHRLDYARGLVPVPTHIADRLGVQNPLDVPAASYAGRCRDETSAYLAQMADPGDSPVLSLVLLARFLFDEAHWGSPYACAAQMVYELVGAELGVERADVPFVRRGEVVRPELAKRFVAIFARPPAELRDAARAAWERAYGEPLPAAFARDVATHARWRH
jgi:hypothetical protein